MKTDTEIAIAALNDWPAEARPPLIRYEDDCSAWYLAEDCIYISDGRAIALFVASGVAFVIDNGLAVWQSEDDGQFRCGRWNSTETFDGPTLLAALDSAIRTTHGGK